MGALREPELLKLECEPRKIQFCILKAQLANYQYYAISASTSRPIMLEISNITHYRHTYDI